MALIHPFRALRPRASEAARVAAVPYDVVNTDEARALADDNPLSFLRVSRAELELPADTDPYATAVYDRAVDNFARLKDAALVVEDEPSAVSLPTADGRPPADSGWPRVFRSTSTIATSSRNTSARGATKKTTARATCSRSALRPVRCS